MRQGDLTSVATIKSWLNVSTANDDAVISRLVSAVSQYIQSWLNRTFLVQTQTEVRNGTGTKIMVFGDYPVVAVQSVVIDGVAIPASSDGVSAGYTWDARTLYLIGYNFRMANSNVRIAYTYGYQKNKEAAVVPAGAQLAATSLLLPWAADGSVNYANGGAALAAVPTVPTAGQYQVMVVSGVPTYVFNAADAGRSIEITYSYVPPEIEQACIELVGLRYRERSRIGENSKSVGGEVVSFSTKDMTDSVKTILNNYRRVISVY